MSFETGLSDLKTVKGFLNIPDSNVASDEKIQTRMADADAFVKVQIRTHALQPIPPTEESLIALASGYAATLFNYWNTPAKDRTLEGINKWEKRIGDYIKSVYGQKSIDGTSGRTFGTSKGVTGTET